VTHDHEADAAHGYLVPDSEADGVARTVLVNVGDDPWMANLDVDRAGRIIGLRVPDASRRLSPRYWTTEPDAACAFSLFASLELPGRLVRIEDND
jgi:hypothetical protein